MVWRGGGGGVERREWCGGEGVVWSVGEGVVWRGGSGVEGRGWYGGEEGVVWRGGGGMREWCGGEGVEKGDGRRETGERRRGKEGKVEGEEVASTFCIMATIYAHVNLICTHTHTQSPTVSHHLHVWRGTLPTLLL